MSPKSQLEMGIDLFRSKSHLQINKRAIDIFGLEVAAYISNLCDKLKYFVDNDMITKDGGFFLVHEQQIKQIGLSEHQIRKCKKKLKDMEILQTEMRGVPSKEFYFLNMEKLFAEVYMFSPRNFEGLGVENSEGKGSEISTPLNENKSNENIDKDQNHKNDSGTRTSSGSARKRRVNRKKRSMRSKVKEKANEKQPKKKNKVSHENKPNLDLLEVWNRQPNLRSHKGNTSNVYKDSLKKLEALRQGTLYKIIKSDELKNDTFANNLPTEWLKQKWKKLDVAKAIKNLNEWCKEGNYPKNKEWIGKISLSDAIYNPRTGTSPLLSAYKNGVQPLFDPYEKLQDEREKAIYQRFEQFFNPEKDSTKQRIVDLTKNLSNTREKYKNAWKQVTPEDYGFGEGVNPGSSLVMVIHYIDFLKGGELNIHGFVPRHNISPLTLKIDGYPWKEFEKAYRDVYNAHPLTGPL